MRLLVWARLFLRLLIRHCAGVMRGFLRFPACHAGPGIQNLVGVVVFKLTPQFASPAFRTECTASGQCQTGNLRRLANGGLSLLFLAPLLFAQGTIRLFDRPPDCYQQFGPLTATGATADYDNRATGCAEWTVTYSSSGFSALSIVAQSAPTIAAGTGPGVYINLAGTISFGVNPNTATTQAETDWSAAYNPWVRVNLTSATGTGQIYGVLYGWRTVPAIKTNVVGSTNVIPGLLTTIQQAFVNVAVNTNLQIIPASGSTQIRITHIDWASTGVADVKLVQGTGVNCATGTADLTALHKGVSAEAQDYGPWTPWTAIAGNAVCYNQSVVQASGVNVLWYYQ